MSKSITHDKSLLVLSPSSPNGSYRPVILGVAGDPTFNQATGSGGWQIVERPKQAAATQWYDRAPFQISIPCMLDPTTTHSPYYPDDDVRELNSWLSAPSLSANVIEPPTIKISGPVIGTELDWVVYSISFDVALRAGMSGWSETHQVNDLQGHRDDLRSDMYAYTHREQVFGLTYAPGAIMQQSLTIVLYEYNPPFASSVKSSSPAQTARRNLKTSSTRSYTVKSNDTLAIIAASQMGKASTVNEQAIIDANAGDKTLNLRSPNQILTTLVGKTIKIPAA